MEWSKVDAGLAGALDDGGYDRFVVFVHLARHADAGLLAELGVEGGGEGLVRTATASAEEVRRLSEQPWVTFLRLSRPLRLGGST